jgi:hypothetical protein
MTLEDPETTIERLYHAMYGNLSSHLNDPARISSADLIGNLAEK